MVRKKISELAKQIRGVSYKPNDLHSSLDDNSVILLRANNIDNGEINFDDVVYVDKHKVSREQYLQKGDILICASSGSKQLVGKAATFDFPEECTFGAFCKVVRPQKSVANYLATYFQSSIYRRKISEVALGASINNIRNEHIDNLEIPVGTDAENEIVVHYISLIQSIINNRRQELKKLDEFVKARFVEMFGDPVSNTQNREIQPFKSFMLNIRYGTSQPPVFSENGEFKFIRATNIKAGRIIEEDMLRISVSEAAKIGKCKLNGNEIIIVRSGVNSGDTCVVSGEYRNQYAGYDIIINLNPGIANPVFFNELMNTNYMQEIIKPLTSRAAQPHINSDQVQNLPMLVASLSEQGQFADFVAQVDKSKVVVQRQIKDLQELFDKKMEEYFGRNDSCE